MSKKNRPRSGPDAQPPARAKPTTGAEKSPVISRRKMIIGSLLGLFGIGGIAAWKLHESSDGDPVHQLHRLIRERYNILYGNCDIADADIVLLSDIHDNEAISRLNGGVIDLLRQHRGDILVLVEDEERNTEVDARNHAQTQFVPGRLRVQGWEDREELRSLEAQKQQLDTLISQLERARQEGKEEEFARLDTRIKGIFAESSKRSPKRTMDMVTTIQQTRARRPTRLIVIAGADHIVDERVETALRERGEKFVAVELKEITQNQREMGRR